MAALGGQSDVSRGSLNLHRQGVQISLRVSRAGHYILGAVDLRKDPSRSPSTCSEASASLFHLVQKFPEMSDGGLHLPCTRDGLYRFGAPLTFAACKAVAPGDPRDGSLTAPKKIVMKLHVT